MANYGSGRSRGWGVFRGAVILLTLALLSFAFGFFVIARLMPGDKPTQTPGNSAPTASPGGNGEQTNSSNGASRLSNRQENRSATPSNQPGPTIDPEERSEVQTPETLEGTNSPPASNDTERNDRETNPASASDTQEAERNPFAAVTPTPGDDDDLEERRSRRRQRDREDTQTPETPDERRGGNTTRTETAQRDEARSEAASPTSGGTGLFRVQSGVYSTREAAEREAGKLNEQGLSASVRALTSAGRTLYRVQHGAYRNRANAEEAQNRLKSAGVDSTISQTD